jgi:uncharacterized delta-60 repeat protein
MKKFISIIQLILLILLVYGIPAYSQEDGTVDTTFFAMDRDAGSGFNGDITEISLQSDGKAVVAGGFAYYNGDPAPHLIRLEHDGTKDHSFNVGTGFSVVSGFAEISSLVMLPDDKILIGGKFNSYNGFSTANIVRLNPDGTVDPLLDMGSGFNDRVESIVLQPDEKMLVGGGFTSYNAEPAPYLIRLNPDGSKDHSFAVDSMVESQVNTLSLQPDGKILVHFGNEVIRLNSDGSYDPSFTLPSPLGSEYIHEDGLVVHQVGVRTIKVLENGKILLAGSMQVTLKSRIPIARLNPDGSWDNNFTTSQDSYFSDSYNEITLTPEGKIYATGPVLRLNSDGTFDASFYPPIGGGSSSAMALQPDGKLIVGESYYTGLNRNRKIIRYHEDGSLDLTYNPIPEFDDRVTAVAVQNDGKIMVGGEFNVYSGQLAQNIVRIGADGRVDQSFNPGSVLSGYPRDRVSEIIPQDDGKILIIGSDTSYDGTSIGRILRLNQDGTFDSSFKSGGVFDPRFNRRDIALQEDGKILVAGNFSSYDGEPAKNIIRLNTDGTRDPSFNLGSGVDTQILEIFPLLNGKILVGGGTDGNPADALVRLNPDGSRDPSFNIGSGFNIHILSIVVQPDEKIVVGGSAGSLVSDPIVVRFNPDGTVDPTFNAELESQSVESIVLQPDGKFLVITDSEDDEKALIRLNHDGTIDPAFHIRGAHTGTGGLGGRSILALAIQPDGNVLVGGEFTTFNGMVANRIVRLINTVEEPDSLTEVIRINAGGEDILFNGEQWQTDQYFSGGKIYTKTNAIENTENDPLYQSERYGSVTYDIPVPEEGMYTAELHFAEIHWQKAGARLFRVAVEGGKPGPVIDLYGNHGGSNTAYVLKMEDIKVDDGKLTIELITEKDNAKISGVAVFKQNPSPAPDKLRINSGGGALDFGGEQWLEDRYFTGGRTYSIGAGEINNTHRDEVYHSERYGEFSYSLPAADEGLYTVEFHLAEIYWDLPDSRIFDIAVENGQFELADLDLYEDYGGPRNAAVIVAKNIKVTDGFLDIAVSKTKDNGKISGLVMYKQPEEVDPHDGFITRINSGGEAMQFAGEEWQADQYYSGGRTYTNTSEGIGDTDKDELFYTERYGEFSYDIPVPATGLYTVELHFAEIHWNREGARVFNVEVENGQYALEDLDLFRELGGSHQSVTFVGNNINVADGILNIDFSKVKENPKVSGIVVYKQSTAGARLQTLDSLSKVVDREESGKLVEGLGSEIRLYPNPARDRVRLEFYAEETGEWDFVLVNSSGTATHMANLNLEIGEYLLEFDLSQYNLSAGTYYVQIMNRRGIFETKRVIIL